MPGFSPLNRHRIRLSITLVSRTFRPAPVYRTFRLESCARFEYSRVGRQRVMPMAGRLPMWVHWYPFREFVRLVHKPDFVYSLW